MPSLSYCSSPHRSDEIPSAPSFRGMYVEISVECFLWNVSCETFANSARSLPTISVVALFRLSFRGNFQGLPFVNSFSILELTCVQWNLNSLSKIEQIRRRLERLHWGSNFMIDLNAIVQCLPSKLSWQNVATETPLCTVSGCQSTMEN